MKSSIEILLDSDSLLDSDDIGNINQTFLSDLSDGSLRNYLSILNEYIKQKKENGLSTFNISQKSHLPELTIKKFENLKTVPKILTVLKILRSVGLKLAVVPISKIDNEQGGNSDV